MVYHLLPLGEDSGDGSNLLRQLLGISDLNASILTAIDTICGMGCRLFIFQVGASVALLGFQLSIRSKY